MAKTTSRRKETTSEAILRKLRRMIMTMELAPGGVVTELGLSQMLDCSRTPVREALQRLALEHLVVAGPRGGVTVADVSVLDLGQLLEAMEQLGAVAIRLAAQRAIDTDLRALEGIVDNAQQAASTSDYAALAELDVAFHTQLYEAGRNHYISEIGGPLHRLFARFVYLSYERAGISDVSQALVEHGQLVASLRDKQVEETVQLHADHFVGVRQRLRILLV